MGVEGTRGLGAYLNVHVSQVSLGVGDLGNGDLEVSIKGRRAASGNSTIGCDLVSDTLGSSEGEAHEGRGDDCRLHLEMLIKWCDAMQKA